MIPGVYDQQHLKYLKSKVDILVGEEAADSYFSEWRHNDTDMVNQ